MSRMVWSVVLVAVIFAVGSQQQQEVSTELPPQDGFYNNLFQPDWGTAGSRLLRKGLPGYSDGAYEMAGQNRPNPLDISQHVHSGKGGEQSSFGRNAMLIFFTQLVLDEILSTGQPGCPPEYEDLPVPSDHPISNFTQRPMVFQRSSYDQRTGYSPNAPRQQTNGVTSYLDGGVVYGTSRMWTNHLRSFKDGNLMADSNVVTSAFPYFNTQRLPLTNAPPPRDHKLKPVTRLFAIGNAKGHESPFLLALQIVWHRYHNKVAANIKQDSPRLSDDQVFNLARNRVIATFQNIVAYEWLPAFLNGETIQNPPVLPGYPGYNPEVRPDITQEFRTASNWKFSLMPAGVWTLKESQGLGAFDSTTTPGRGPQNEPRSVTSVRQCNHYWDSQDLVRENLDVILRGMIWTLSEKEDEIVAPDLRASYYGPFEYSRQDAVAMEIQRDRDHGVGDLNTVLQDHDMQPITSWDQFGPRGQVLRDLYTNGTGSPDDVDLFTGALMLQGSNGIPNIFRQIILRQFARIREADRFWFENQKNGMFTAAEISEIRNTTFSDVLRQTTNLSPRDLQNVFICTGPGRCLAPPGLEDESNPTTDVCTAMWTYDYITGSELSFAVSFTALFLVIPGSMIVLWLMAKRRERHQNQKALGRSRTIRQKNPNKHHANEWQGTQSGERSVCVEFDPRRKKVMVRDGRGKELRFIDLRKITTCGLRTTGSGGTLMAFRIEGEVDLILRFEDSECCNNFMTELRNFLESLGVTIKTTCMSEAQIKENSISRDERQAVLDEFFRLACLQAMAEDGDHLSGLDPGRVDAVVNVKLTRTEFAEALGMQPSSIFVRNIFLLADSDNDGFVSFHEFLGLFAVFLKGTAEEKARLMFNVYDVWRRGVLTRSDFTKMIKSLMELSENAGDVSDDSTLQQLVGVMFRQAGIEHKDEMTFEDFRRVFASKEYASTLQAATLANQGPTGPGANQSRDIRQRKSRLISSYRRKKKKSKADPASQGGSGPDDTDARSRIRSRRSQIRLSVRETQAPPRSPKKRYLYSLTKLVEVYYLHIFWTCLYTLVTCGIFIERAYFYAAGREHAGLRRLSGAWTTAMIRGSASVIMFTYVGLLLTMCRNIITRMRETFLHRFVPFDSAVAFHKYIAVLAMIATIVHIVGHGTNLYCMCTQSTTNVNCFFRDYFTPSDGQATFFYWGFQTITGLAGVLVTALIFVMYVFAAQWARRKVFTAFWFTHSLYPLVYVLTFLHGIGRLVQDPLFPWYLIGPLVIFVLDRLMSASRNRIEIPVIKAELLPSDVIMLLIKRPSNIDYKSGQWVRVACLKLGKEEYHPFTLTSAPHEKHLSLHIRAVGPWTNNLRQAYDKDVLGGEPYPKLYLDGPFGEGHQDWYSCDVAVLVGGGIGVTPFASILKDIAFKSRTGALISCQKVYFLWVTRTQKSFEWMTDVIREVEDTDTRDVVDTHIFVTQFKQKYDLRTTMLYICERHFQKVEGRSLFTGLKATTHFGRPDFVEFLYSLQLEHPQVRRFGVFSCGPGPMTSSVQAACTTLNKTDGYTYTHHYENF